MSKSNTERTLAALKALGYKCGIVERYLAHAGPHGLRKDLFGIIDIIAIDVARGLTLGVQSCGQAYAEHFRTITEDRRQESLDWIKPASNVLELWGWRKVVKKRGSKVKVWRPRVHRFDYGDFYDILKVK